MSNVDPTRLVTNLIAAERLTTPSVDRTRGGIRRDLPFFVISSSMVKAKARSNSCSRTAYLLGTLVIEWGYDVPFNRHDDFKKWLIANEASIAAAVPPDVTYRGTYAVSATSEKNSGLYRTIWAFTTLRALENFDDEMSSGSAFARLIADLNAFRDRERGTDYSQQIHQPARCAHRYG